MPTINVHKLSFAYGNHTIFQQLDFDIESGCFISIVGPNGSGKSTLLKNLSSALSPQTGAVFLDGQDIFQMNKKNLARQMAVVPQDNRIDFQFSVWETVLMGRLPHQKRFSGENGRDLAVSRWAMELTNTWHLRDRLITNLSGGELQRAVVARALTQEPRVLLLDEPTSHLDLQHQFELLELLKTLNETKGLTVIAVLHDLNLAAQFSQKVMLLNRGSIMALGTPGEVLTLQNIKDVYQIEAAISANEMTGRFNIIPMGKVRQQQHLEKSPAIHLVCGGGKGAFLMDQLFQYGYQLSCGVLNVGDTDWHKARELGITIVEEAPFAPISPKAQEANKRILKKSSVIVVLPVPVGPGNLPNLQQVLTAQEEWNKPVILVEAEELKNRDFTGGKAKSLVAQMESAGAVGVNEAREVLETVSELVS